MTDAWDSLIQKVKTLLKPNPFILTTKGKIARVESYNNKVGTVAISFGSFEVDGSWKIQTIITISDNNIAEYISKEVAAQKLSKLFT